MSEAAPDNAARPLVAAGALFLDEHDGVLLVKPCYKPGWEIPGGYVEAGESPLDACLREVKEELGVSPEIGSLLTVDWAPHPDQGDKLLFIFDGGVLTSHATGQIRLPENELSDWRFSPVDELENLLIPRLARRVHQSIAARSASSTRYLEHGIDEAPLN